MKKIIKKFWGVAFVVVLLSSLFVGAVPQASAGPQSFSYATLPTDPNGITAIGVEIYDFAVAPSNQAVIYAATSANALKSVDQGRTWTHLATGNATTDNRTSLVAVAPDDANVVVYVSNVGAKTVAISLNGGLSFFQMGTPQDGAHLLASAIFDVDISQSFTDLFGYTYRYIGIAGVNAGGTAAFFYAKFGAYTPLQWLDAVVDAPITGLGYTANDAAFVAVKFSPSFGVDNIVYLMSQNATSLTCELHVVSLNIAGRFDNQITGYTWYNNGTGGGTPLFATATAAVKGQILFDPAYQGVAYSPYARLAYASVATVTGTGGSCRIIEDANGIPSAVPVVGGAGATVGIWSIGLNAAGSTLVSASSFSSTVYTQSSPWLVPAAANLIIKRIGGGTPAFGGVTTVADNMTIAYAGNNVVCSKANDMGAFSLSIDNGYTFNDISLVNTNMAAISDQVIEKTAGIQRYVVSTGNSSLNNNWVAAAHTSVFYWDGTYWTRVFVRYDATDGWVAKASPDSFATLYLGDTTNATIYYTATNGMSDWRPRVAPLSGTSLVDIEVQTSATFYAATNVGTTGYVCPLTFSGQYWNASDYISVFGPNTLLASLTLVSADNVLAGSQTGRVAYTTSGGHTPPAWSLIPVALTVGGYTIAEAASLAPFSVVYACSNNNARLYGYVIGSGSAAWFPVSTSPYFGVGGYSIDVLIYGTGTAQCIYYLSGNDTTQVTLARSFITDAILPPPANGWLATTLSAFVAPTTAFGGVQPDALKGSVDPSGLPGNDIWFIDRVGMDRFPSPMKGWGDTLGVYPQIITYTDELAVTVPAITAPINGYIVQVNAETGIAYDVALVWTPAAGALTYHVQIAMDSAFVNIILQGTAISPLNIGPWAPVWVINYQPGEVYYWRVRANSPFFSHWTTTYTLNIQPAPIPVPELLGPGTGATVNTLTPSFSWTPMSGTATGSGVTTSYTLQLGTDPNFTVTSLIHSFTITNTTGFKLPAGYLIDGSTYYWRVGSATVPPGDWSATSFFSVDLALPTVTVTSTTTAVPATIGVPSGSATHTDSVVNPSYIWAIIIIGAVLVIAIIVLIFRTKRV